LTRCWSLMARRAGIAAGSGRARGRDELVDATPAAPHARGEIRPAEDVVDAAGTFVPARPNNYLVMTNEGTHAAPNLAVIFIGRLPLVHLARAIHWIRGHYDETLHVEELAALATMDVSSLHRHFCAVTSMTPIPFQKQIRLHEARARLLAEPGDVAGVGFAVGYGNPSQFSREYRRIFGVPPSGDTLVGRTAIARRGARTGREAAAGETEVVVPVPWGQLPPLEIWSSLNWFRSPGATSSYGARAGPVDDG
jgi:AraC-like DNA-binding protein